MQKRLGVIAILRENAEPGAGRYEQLILVHAICFPELVENSTGGVQRSVCIRKPREHNHELIAGHACGQVTR